MAMILSQREIDALLEIGDGTTEDISAFCEEIALHERIYKIFRSDDTVFATSYDTSIEGYPYKKLKPILERIKNQVILSTLYDHMSSYAQNIYEALCMKRNDTYILYESDRDNKAEEDGRTVAAIYNNLGKRTAFVDAYIYMLHLPQTYYDNDTKLVHDLQQVEKTFIRPLHEICEVGYPLRSWWMKIIHALQDKMDLYREADYEKKYLERYASFQQHDRLEFSTKKELVDKFIFISILSRRDGIQTGYDMCLEIETLPLLKTLFTDLLNDRFIPSFEVHKQHYLNDMRQKLEFIAQEFIVPEDEYAGIEIPQDTQNPNYPSLEEYTMEELIAKRDHYRRIYTKEGIFASEQDAYEEKNSFLKAVLSNFVDGYEMEWIKKYILNELRYRMRHYETLFDIMEAGFILLYEGDSPRAIHQTMMSFFEEAQRWEYDTIS